MSKVQLDLYLVCKLCIQCMRRYETTCNPTKWMAMISGIGPLSGLVNGHKNYPVLFGDICHTRASVLNSINTQKCFMILKIVSATLKYVTLLYCVFSTYF